MAELEKLNDIQKQTHGGARKGAGRKLHSKNPATITREEAARQFKERVAKNVDKLFNSQLDLAIGEKYLMVTKTIGSGAKARRETTTVTNVELIKKYLDEDLEDNETEYYFMSTKPANNSALESLLNRSFGTAQSNVDITSGGETIQSSIIEVINGVYDSRPEDDSEGA